MAYHHALACISSPKVYIISRRLYPLSQWWYTRLSPWWYAKLRFDDMHACGVIWYVSSSLYKNSWKYLFCAMAKNKSARVIGCSREQRPQMEQGNGTKVIGGATLWRLCRQYHFAPVEKNWLVSTCILSDKHTPKCHLPFLGAKITKMQGG